MKAEELRIGNLVLQKTSNEIRGVDYYDIMHGIKLDDPRSLCEWNGISPILINEEWLKRFGFKKFWEWGGVYSLTIKNQFIEFRKPYKTGGLCANDQFVNKIKYVHQLQNLYFALTGKELQIK